MASLTEVVDLGKVVDSNDPDIYGSGKAIILGIKAGFTGRDSEDNIIKPSGSGKNKGKFLLGDLKKCPAVQEWIKNNEDNNNNEVKEKKDFSGEKAKEAFDKLGMTVEEYEQKGGKRSGKRTANSITCKDIKEFLKDNGDVVDNNNNVDEDKMFTTKKMKAKIDELGPRSKGIAMEYLRNNHGVYKSKKWWGKKEIEAAIKEINKQ